MKKFFKYLVYFLTTVILFVPFIMCFAFGFIAWLLFSLYDLVFDWAHE